MNWYDHSMEGGQEAKWHSSRVPLIKGRWRRSEWRNQSLPTPRLPTAPSSLQPVGLSHRQAPMSGTALIIVDIQNDFLPPSGSLPVPKGRNILELVYALLTDGRWKDLWSNVVVSQVESSPPWFNPHIVDNRQYIECYYNRLMTGLASIGIYLIRIYTFTRSIQTFSSNGWEWETIWSNNVAGSLCE